MTEDPIWPDDVFADLDRSGPVPLYFQVSSRLEDAIRSGRIPPGARLQNEIEISRRLRLSRPTVRHAIQTLVNKGLLVRRRGIGTQVVQGRVTRPVELTSLYDDLESTHRTPSTRVLVHELRPADERAAEALSLPVGSEVAYLRRVRSIDGEPVAVLENHLLPEFGDVTTDELTERGLYQILRARGVTFQVARQRIGARAAEGDEAELLEIPSHGPLLTMERVAFDTSGRAVEFGTHCYRPDRYSFETTVVAD
ncbi:GntR family transcriptional regulator [Microbacterium sp. Marseille-Q6965]|jgi:DNA-binding GntR family transcriptional regulator|uniref:GntR family transcriptional regulator n=1 Tax=Microbacterium sp. Marseille-Q6965 TaxID=2965072 RepID=UPI0021B83487|nr:GntR family transcriptional regulator [Microbacterium sp. Marseille-Q6965]